MHRDVYHGIICNLKQLCGLDLASVAQLVGVSSHYQKFAGSIPHQGTYLSCRFHPWFRDLRPPVWVCAGGDQLMFLSHIDVSPSPFLFL